MELTNEFRVNVPIEDAWNVLTDVERIAPCMPGAQLQEVEGDDYRGVVKVKVGPITAQYKGTATFVSKDDANKKAVLKAEGRDTRGQGNASATVTASCRPDGDATAVTVVTDLTVTGKVAQFGRGVLADVSQKLLKQFVECLHEDLLAHGAGATARSGATSSGSAGVSGAGSGGTGSSGDGAGGAPKGSAGGNGQVATATTTPGGSPAASGSPPAATGGSGSAAAATEAAGATIRRVEHREVEPVDLLDAAGAPVAKRAVPLVGGLLVMLWFLRRRRRHRRARRGR